MTAPAPLYWAFGRRWCNSCDWTVANQALTIRTVQKVVQFGAEMVPASEAEVSGSGQWSVVIF